MNSIKEINRINQRELELGVSGKGSWHDQYKDSAYVFVGGLPYDLTEGDVITVFSQWGEIADVNLPRDKTTGKTKGFGFVMFEDQRSTVLAVDNMNGALVLKRTIRVDHCRKYNQPGTKNDEGDHVEPENPTYNALPPTLEGSEESSSESEGADSLDGEDPMAAFLRADKKKQKAKAKAKGLTNGEGRKRKHDGETREERRVRKESKRARKAAKGVKRGVKREDREPLGADGRGRIKRERSEDVARSKGAERDGNTEERLDGRKGRGDRDDWREGRWELERNEKRERMDGVRDGRDGQQRNGRRNDSDRGREDVHDRRTGDGDDIRRGDDRAERDGRDDWRYRDDERDDRR